MICEKCGKEFVDDWRKDKDARRKPLRFCSKSCTNSRVWTEEINQSRSFKLKKSEHIGDLKECKICGQMKRDHELGRGHCSWLSLNLKRCPDFLKKVGIDESALGTPRIFEEINLLRSRVEEVYYASFSGLKAVKEQFGFSYHPDNLLKYLKVPRRSLSESTSLAHLYSRQPKSRSKYKTEYHVTWDGRTVFLRSSYESEFATLLDSQKVYYEVERVRIRYWDSVREAERTAVADFYIPETREVIEVKSIYTYNEQNMVDRFDAYTKMGFKPKLWLDKQFVTVRARSGS